MTPEAYNERELLDGRLTIDHVETLVRFWQQQHGLVNDGKAGPKTRLSVAGAGRLVSDKTAAPFTFPKDTRIGDEADVYNAVELQAGRLTMQHLVTLVGFFQARAASEVRPGGLKPDVDGKAGPVTRRFLEAVGAALRAPPRSQRCYPLPLLSDLRKPQITSRYKDHNPDRKTHDGVDLFYRWQESDGLVPVGDGGATRDKDGKTPKWFIPKGLKAIAAADGIVVLASATGTGHRIWVQHYDGTSTGYFHLYDIGVELGARVTMGTPLGTVGDNPSDVDAKHLHFESVKGAVNSMSRAEYKAALVDPETWLEGATYVEAA